MNIVTILGSARRKGNSATILNIFEEIVSEKHNIIRCNIPSNGIYGCIGCDRCQNEDNIPACIYTDEISNIIDNIIKADLVVYCSPVYVWDVTAQLKALFDRQYSLVKWRDGEKTSLVKNKKTMLLTTCAGNANENIDLITEIFRREMDYMQCHNQGVFYKADCTTPTLGDQEDIKIAQEMSATIM